MFSTTGGDWIVDMMFKFTEEFDFWLTLTFLYWFLCAATCHRVQSTYLAVVLVFCWNIPYFRFIWNLKLATLRKFRSLSKHKKHRWSLRSLFSERSCSILEKSIYERSWYMNEEGSVFVRRPSVNGGHDASTVLIPNSSYIVAICEMLWILKRGLSHLWNSWVRLSI